MHRIKTFLVTKPVFLYLLPFFFVLHGFTEYANTALTDSALLLLLTYIGISFSLSRLFWLLLKNFYKANLFSFLIMAYIFFFGSVHDFAKNYVSNFIFVRYSFILPFTAISFIILYIVLLNTKRRLAKTTKFLNLLLLIFIIIDTATLVVKMSNARHNIDSNFASALIQCDTCLKPDIYLIVADEYPGNTTLKDVFLFDNSQFEMELQKRGFHIINNSVSNYNHTYYSMASLFNMEYLDLKSNFTNHTDMLTCGSLIKNNNLVNFFKKKGYSFYNHSFFEFAGKQNAIENPFYTTPKRLFTSQTFFNRLQRDIGYHFTSKKLIYSDKVIDSLTLKTALGKNSVPKFVYTHLNMPHHPYYFDRNGSAVQASMTNEHKFNKTAFLEYLLYTNNKLLQLIDHIKRVSKTSPIIILMSDHGFRQFPNFNSHEKYHFINFNSIYLPNKNYSGFYDGMSNVNQFRVLLNSQFGQRLPLLKDSSIFLKE